MSDYDSDGSVYDFEEYTSIYHGGMHLNEVYVLGTSNEINAIDHIEFDTREWLDAIVADEDIEYAYAERMHKRLLIHTFEEIIYKALHPDKIAKIVNENGFENLDDYI